MDCEHFNKIFYLFIFRERRREGETEGEKHQSERESLTGCLSHVPRQRTESATQAYALPRNRTSDFSLCGATPNPAEPHATSRASD